MGLPSTSRKDVSENELKLRQLDRRDMMLKFYIATLTTIAVVLLLFVALSNRTNIVEHRQRNEEVHLEIENYIRCVVLLRYAEPPITPESPEKDVTAALDKCAITKPKSGKTVVQ